jgi:hypothetical protein
VADPAIKVKVPALGHEAPHVVALPIVKIGAAALRWL